MQVPLGCRNEWSAQLLLFFCILSLVYEYFPPSFHKLLMIFNDSQILLCLSNRKKKKNLTYFV